MIIGFEKITEELNEKEREVLLPILIKVLKVRIGKKKSITNKKIVAELARMGHKTSGPRIRKIIHVIRIYGGVERLIATSSGYFVASNEAELKTYIESLHQRVTSISSIISQLEYQLYNYKKESL